MINERNLSGYTYKVLSNLNKFVRQKRSRSVISLFSCRVCGEFSLKYHTGIKFQCIERIRRIFECTFPLSDLSSFSKYPVPMIFVRATRYLISDKARGNIGNGI